MKTRFYSDNQEKTRHVGFRLSINERQQLDEFCEEEDISITDFLRFAVAKIINQYHKMY